jgi:hypothetical protein
MGEFEGRRKMDEKDMKITQQPTHRQWIYMDALKKNLVQLKVTLQSPIYCSQALNRHWNLTRFPLFLPPLKWGIRFASQFPINLFLNKITESALFENAFKNNVI